jgi:short-subunit dehydrogenase
VLTICPGAVDTEFFTPEMLERLPEAARRMMIRPEKVVDATMNALASGRRNVTVPRPIAVSYAIKLFFPGLFRRIVQQVTRRTVSAG